MQNLPNRPEVMLRNDDLLMSFAAAPYVGRLPVHQKTGATPLLEIDYTTEK